MIKNATAFEDDFADFVAGAGMADAFANLPRTVNGTGHTGPSEFCATSI